MSKNIFMAAIIARGLAAITALCGAVYLASNGNDGWGWMIFVGLLLGDISFKASAEKSE
jgi:uncharacterized membrane protein HdeD (DUF308 family)